VTAATGGAVSGGVEGQRVAMAGIYGDEAEARWGFHYTTDPLVRYLRDRRLGITLRIIGRQGRLDPGHQSVLLVCGGIGGEGTYLRNLGFREVTVSDLSAEALRLCRRFDPRLQTRELNAEDMAEVADGSYDFVVVQDGLHHLPRPVLGLTEMLRVARQGVAVIEPHYGLVGRALGTEWEVQGDAVNYVFRWSKPMLEQVTRSYLVSRDAVVVAHRLWDHPLLVGKAAERLPRRMRHAAARAVYGALTPVRRWGNMMVGVVLKPAVTQLLSAAG
jgi:SAM-dependent methyltransferase